MVAVQGGLEQRRQHFLSIREVAKENMKKWSTELDKVVSRVQDRADGEHEKDRQAKIQEMQEPVFKAMLMGQQRTPPLRKTHSWRPSL